MQSLLNNEPIVLMEASIVERLRRGGEVSFHPELEHGLLIYDVKGRAALGTLFQEYIDIAREADLPLLLCTPTWKTSPDRLERLNVESDVNGDAVKFMQEIVSSQGAFSSRLRIGGLIGSKNDCYRPDQGLGSAEAEAFHLRQIGALVRAGADFLIAETLPSLGEAIGIARAMAASGTPYVISFVIDRTGRVLDGTSLLDAMQAVDAAVEPRPVGFMINCAHPSFLCPEQQPAAVYQRLVGYQANASSRDHCDLDGASDLEVDSISVWGEQMLALNRRYGMPILGGCCGTGAEHLRYLADRLRD